MKKSIFILTTTMLFLTNGALLNAQVTVGANKAPNATLDVVYESGNNTHAGVIAPNVDRNYLNNKTYGTNQTGAIVYVTGNPSLNGTATEQAINVKSVGYYYFDGTVWQGFGGGIKSLNITEEKTSSYTALVTDDVVLLYITTGGQRLTLPGEAENTPIGKIIYFSNRGNQDMQLADCTQLRNPAYCVAVPMNTDAAYMYIGGGKWISLTSY